MKENSVDYQCRFDVYKTTDNILDTYQKSTREERYSESFLSM